LRLLALLEGGELCVCQTVAVLEQAASTVSGHLSELKRAGLVQERREGKLVFHRWADDRATRALLKDVVGRCATDPVVTEDRALVERLRQVDVAVLCAADLDLAAVGVRSGRNRAAAAPAVRARG
jgi:DNA-binding transcriptional ArsR family regulator